MKKSINLKSLSEKLSLSQTTVSRALNGYPEVSEKTRSRVIEMAKHYNYRPSSSASKLARGKSHAIGHVVPLENDLFFTPYFSDFIAGAVKAYANNHYELLLHADASTEEETVYRELAQSKRVDGVVVHDPEVDDSRIALLNEIGLPFIVHGRSDNCQLDYSWMDVDNYGAMFRATEFLIQLGHQRIGFINGLEVMNFAASRRRGFEDAMRQHHLTINDEHLFSDVMIEAVGFNAANTMLRHKQPPTAIITSGILVAMGVQRAVLNTGKRLGTDISVVTYDDCLSFLNTSNNTTPSLFTCMRSSIYEAGEKVAQMLIAQIEGKNKLRTHELWKAELVIGQSTGTAQKN